MSNPTTAPQGAAEQNGPPATVQTLRAQLRQLTRERLVDSASRLFASQGFRATSIGEIAKAAGTTPTTFYRYFNSKSDIARLLQDRINVEVQKTLDQLDDIKRPGRRAIRGWVAEYDQMWQRMHELCDAYWEAARLDPQLASELVPVTFRLTDNMQMVRSVPEGAPRRKFQVRLVLMYILMDRLLYIVDIQERNSIAMQMLDEFSEIFRAALFENER
jgi:AcrR family transcriptional regulator